MNKIGVVIGIIAVLVLGGGFYILNQESNDSPNTNNTPQGQQDEDPLADLNARVEETNVINYTNDGFSPRKTRFKAGETITVVNNSSGILQFSSDPHPQHTDDEELNLGSIAPGKTASFTVDEPNFYSFHNHLKPEHIGSHIAQ